MTETATTGHVGGAGLDLTTLNMMIESLGDFVDEALSPERVLELDHEDECPEDVVRAMSDPNTLGVQLVFIPEAYGGMDGGAFDSYRVCEAMGRKDIGLATAVFATFLGSDPIVVGATEEQKQEWLGAIAEEGVVFAYGATEPEAGSDLGAMTTTADPITGDDGEITAYKINGRKQWISNGSIADFTTILAATPEGPTWFVVPKDTPGFSAGPPEDKHGLRLSNTAALFLDDVEVPAHNLIGTEAGKGLVQAQQVFGYTRLMVAAFGLGGGWEALDRAIAYSKERVQGGSALSEKQGFTHKLIVPHAVRLEAARAFMEDTADKIDRGLGENGAMNTEGAIAKYLATEAGNAAADAAIQAHGGYGYTRPYVVEKIKRDVRITTIYEGTSEIMEMTIARDRWQLHLKSMGRRYTDLATELEQLNNSKPDVGAGIAALGARAMAAVLEACKVGRLTRSQHVLFRLGELIAYCEGASEFAKAAAAAQDGARHEKNPGRFDGAATSAMARVYAREAAQRIALDGARYVAGAADPGSPALATLAGVPTDAIRAAQAGMLTDMDYIADVLYGRLDG
ncbi:acyl-CoA dehydrogenase family protein [Nostocoides australiense]|uniref:Acyl-CoA dehydrogenase domain protein n=1 Tax=Nostocoides australiense Ben110 TaxID=1193182 RepID=W6JTC6_9MICO|nr:acyl-CoA dehydrogenase family protein [Tetrasphaera australiensis]CCH72027.1 Acyl-CoA dehydrogenase domain protein [Tetrasphaera australiensis Ben110]HPF81053.1 acyl-CoA dehydrogenase family protein [Tetrasphaera australiensis]